jgi:G3E family GTPase
MNDPRIPVTLLTGFLGAGKTTLLNALLADASAGRIAVIVNEFGEAGLDHDLIEAVDEEIVLMRSGCLCCSVRRDLSRTMTDLVRRRDYGEIAFERVVIETTGLADPGPILQTLLIDPFLARHTRMDGVVTVADAANGPATLDAQFEAVSQVAMADLVVVSKSDLVPPARLEALDRRLKGINPRARLIHAIRGEGLAGKVWGLTGLRHGATAADAMAWTSVAPPKAMTLENLSGLSRPAPRLAPSSPHDSRIGTASIILDEPIPDAVFDIWLETLIELAGPDILRVKGIVFLAGLDTPFVFHGVQHVFDPPVPIPDWSGEDRRSRIVVIAATFPAPICSAASTCCAPCCRAGNMPTPTTRSLPHERYPPSRHRPFRFPRRWKDHPPERSPQKSRRAPRRGDRQRYVRGQYRRGPCARGRRAFPIRGKAGRDVERLHLLHPAR